MHLGRDKRIYLLDLARTFPAESPAVARHLPVNGTTVFFRCFRGELLRRWRQAGHPPLSSDALTAWSQGQPDTQEQNQLVSGACRFLVSVVIPSFAGELLANAESLERPILNARTSVSPVWQRRQTCCFEAHAFM